MTFPILDPQEIEQYLGYCAPSSIYTPEGYNGGMFGKGQHIEVSWVKNEKLQENYFFALTSPKSVWAYDQGENEGPHDLLVGETVEGYWFFLSAGSGFYTGC